MKSIKIMVAFAAALFMGNFSAQAQNLEEQSAKVGTEVVDNFNPKHEIYASYGMGSTTDLKNCFNELGDDIAANIFGKSRVCKGKDFGNINFGYGYHVGKKIIVGATFSYSQFKGDIESKGMNAPDSEWKKIGSKDFQYYTIMPNVKVNWINTPHLALYSRVGLGARINYEHEEANGKIETKQYSKLAYQVTVAGFEAGSRNFRGFAEVGFGQNGIGQIGCRVLF